MLNKKIERIIIKYLSKSASTVEIIELTEWISEYSNELIFREFVRTNYLIDANMLNFDTEGEKEKVLQKIKENEKRAYKNKLNSVFKYAAIFLVALGLGYTYVTDNFSFQEKQNTITDIEIKIMPGIDKAVLTLENGSNIILEKGKNFRTKNLNSNGEELVYNSNPTYDSKISYNYLTIPRGGQFYVKLEDGTRVWLNSESKIKYPKKFIKGETRKVELIYGEAYFDVSPETNHNGSKFRVVTQMQEIEVLGTEFNIKAYRDEDNIYTTLIEGKITIGNGIEYKFLKPSEQSVINVKNQDITIRKVNKLFDEIAWKNGYFSFKHKSMKEIMKTLSRWYDMDYVFKDLEKENKVFTGVLDRESTIDQILKYIQMTNEISFQINDKTVIIE